MVIYIKTIKEEITNEIEIKNSRFITRIFKADQENIPLYLNQVKQEYPKATHYCYAYISKNCQKSFDDNEPTGTAGKPILNVLEKEKLEKVLVIIIRYFGGIKLGAGGLIRAYTKATTEALQKATFQEVVDAYKIKIQFPYTDEKKITYLLKEENIIKKEFQEEITYWAIIEKEKLPELNNIKYEIIEETTIKRDS